MTNKERIARWRGFSNNPKLIYHNQHVIEMVDMLERQQVELEELIQERDRFRAAINDECLNWQFTIDEENPRESMRQLLNITATIARDPSVCEEAANFALEQQLKGVEDALKNIPETRHGNWPMALVRKYVIDMRQKVKNEDEL